VRHGLKLLVLLALRLPLDRVLDGEEGCRMKEAAGG